MKLATLIILTLLLSGCGPSEQEINAHKEADWKYQIAIETMEATTRMYQCASEIYTVRNGPLCQEACSMYASLRNQELNPPKFVTQPLKEDEILGVTDDGVCPKGKP